MAAHTDPAVALLSIHPRHAAAIMRGEKKVEFRKRPFGRQITHVVVYATAPVARIVGAFRVAGCDMASPDRLWARYGTVGGIDRAFFDAYYGTRTSGVAIRVDGDPVPLDLPLAATGQTCPPQSYAYLDQGVAESMGVLAAA